MSLYSELLASNPNAGGDFIKGLFTHLSFDSIASLGSEFKDEEIKTSLK